MNCEKKIFIFKILNARSNGREAPGLVYNYSSSNSRVSEGNSELNLEEPELFLI